MKKSSPFLPVFIVLVLLAAGRWISVSDSKRLSPVSNALGTAFLPVRSAASFAVARYDDTALFFASRAALRGRIKTLEKENEGLKRKAVAKEDLRLRISELEEQLKLQKSIPFKNIPAEVMYRSASSWFHSVTINAGKKQNAVKGCAVFNNSGLIGQIVSAGQDMSVISSITDGGSSIGGMIKRSGSRGLVQGDYSACLTFNYLPPEADIKKGDVCISSGDGQLVPPGIPIGKVVSVRYDKTSDTKIARVKPFVHFDKVSIVFVAVNENER